MTDKELKPCPHCGSTLLTYDFNCVHDSKTITRIICLDCMDSMPNEPEEALEIWNSRPSPWVSCADRLPEKKYETCKEYLVTNGTSSWFESWDIHSGEYDNGNYGWYDHPDAYITHWQEITLPKEAEDE